MIVVKIKGAVGKHQERGNSSSETEFPKIVNLGHKIYSEYSLHQQRTVS
jgi:hypothetical protein